MILFAVLTGFYAIGITGYFKLSFNLATSDPDTKAAMESYPKVYKGALAVLSLIWPVMMYWALVKEAAK